MAITVPPPPYKVPLTNDAGFLSQPWIGWFNQLFARAGGTVALSNVELANLPNADLAAVEADIAALQLLTTSHGTTLTSLASQINDLDQGPVL